MSRSVKIDLAPDEDFVVVPKSSGTRLQSELPLAIEPVTQNIFQNPVQTTSFSRTVDVPVSSLGKINYDPDYASESRAAVEIPEQSESQPEINITPITENPSGPPLQILPTPESTVTNQVLVQEQVVPPNVQQNIIVSRPISPRIAGCHPQQIHFEEEGPRCKTEKEIELEEEYLLEEHKDEHQNIFRNPIGYPIIILVIGVILIIIINMIFIARAPATDKNGNPINSDLKWSAMIMTTAITIILIVFFAGFLYYARKLTLVDYQWLVLSLTLFFLLLVALFTAYIAGWWMNIGFLWAPTSIPAST